MGGREVPVWRFIMPLSFRYSCFATIIMSWQSVLLSLHDCNASLCTITAGKLHLIVQHVGQGPEPAGGPLICEILLQMWVTANVTVGLIRHDSQGRNLISWSLLLFYLPPNGGCYTHLFYIKMLTKFSDIFLTVMILFTSVFFIYIIVYCYEVRIRYCVKLPTAVSIFRHYIIYHMSFISITSGGN